MLDRQKPTIFGAIFDVGAVFNKGTELAMAPIMRSSLAIACAFASAIFGAAFLTGCSGGTDSSPSQTGTSATTDSMDATGELTLSPVEGGLSGEFVLASRTLKFQAITQSVSGHAPATSMSVDVNGMTLTALIDAKSQVGDLDAFATSNGGDTQISDDDRTVLLAFDRAIATAVTNDTKNQLPEEAHTIVRMADLWSDTPSSASLTRQVLGQENRSYTSICGQFGTYQYATHDDWNYNDWNAKSTSVSLVGSRWGGSTYYLVNNNWITTTQDHKAYVYEAGDCYARCGAGCSSGNQVLTADCNNHDQCVRNGHSITSVWCDDEFSACVDDFAFAPTCANTSHD